MLKLKNKMPSCGIAYTLIAVTLVTKVYTIEFTETENRRTFPALYLKPNKTNKSSLLYIWQ